MYVNLELINKFIFLDWQKILFFACAYLARSCMPDMGEAELAKVVRSCRQSLVLPMFMVSLVFMFLFQLMQGVG